MPVFADMAMVAIEKAIQEDPTCAIRLHAAVMVHGGPRVQAAFAESEGFEKWRENQRSIGRVDELGRLSIRLLKIVRAFEELGETSLAEEFGKLARHVAKRCDKLAAEVMVERAERSNTPFN